MIAFAIDNGRFDFEFQALREHAIYVGMIEGFQNDEVKRYINDKLNQLSRPIKTLIEQILEQKFPGINLSAAETGEFSHLDESTEKGRVLVSSGMIIGTTI